MFSESLDLRTSRSLVFSEGITTAQKKFFDIICYAVEAFVLDG